MIIAKAANFGIRRLQRGTEISSGFRCFHDFESVLILPNRSVMYPPSLSECFDCTTNNVPTPYFAEYTTNGHQGRMPVLTLQFVESSLVDLEDRVCVNCTLMGQGYWSTAP